MMMMMRIRALLVLWGCIAMLAAAGAPDAVAQTGGNAPVHALVLLPGDARSVRYEFNSILAEPGSLNVALISAFTPDEIRTLTVQITPVGDVGSEISYVTGGAFFSFSPTAIGFVRLFEPRFTFGYNSVTYTMDVYPWMSLGFLLSGAVATYARYDFPLPMSMTVSLSN
jgi:hypothetical protein